MPDGCVSLEKGYSRIRFAYDQIRYLSRKARFAFRCESSLLRQAIIKYAPKRRLLVDVACGTGHYTCQVADLFERVVGVD